MAERFDISKLGDIFEQMTSAQKRDAIDSIQKMIDAERFNLATEHDDEKIACRECGSLHVVKRGKSSSGNQRYLCKDCGMSFVIDNGGVFSKSKLSGDVWQKYVECFIDHLPLRECAERCGVSLKTSWFMRHRILEALFDYMPSFQVKKGCGAELDETFFRENFKGNHSRSEFVMPRRSRTSGGQDCKRGISNDLICVMTGVNDANDMFFDVACRGRLDSGTAKDVLKDKIEAGAIISTDKLASYTAVMGDLKVACHKAYDSKTEHGGINKVNTLHSQIKFFFERFKGVSSKHLHLYLAWFKWEESFRKQRSAKEAVEVIVRQLSNGSYQNSWRKCKEIEYPFFGYWKKQAA